MQCHLGFGSSSSHLAYSQGKHTFKSNSNAYEKYGMDIWVVGKLNQLFMSSSYTRLNFDKIKDLVAKPRSLS